MTTITIVIIITLIMESQTIRTVGETAAAAVSALTSSAGNSDSVVCIDLEDEQPGFDNGRISDDDDNGVIIVGERPAEPRQTVTLHLPGGERLEINARETDQPMHRSFEWQQDVSEARRRLLRRRRRRARELFSLLVNLITMVTRFPSVMTVHNLMIGGTSHTAKLLVKRKWIVHLRQLEEE